MRVEDILPYSSIKGDIEANIEQELESLVQTKIDTFSSAKKRILSNGYKIAMFVMFLTIVIGLIMYLIRSSVVAGITKEIVDRMGNHEIYNRAISVTKLAEIDRPARISKKIHFEMKPPIVPFNAWIVKNFDGVRGITDRNTSFISNAAKFKWIERRGKETYVRYYTQGMLIIGTDFMNEFEFTITKENFFKKIFSKEKLQLENLDFEKMYHIVRNDEIKLRQCFTPLSQENYVKYGKDVVLPYFTLTKVYDEIIITWETQDDYLRVTNSSISGGTAREIARGIFKNISKDVSQLYIGLAYALTLPLYSTTNTMKKEIGSETSHKKLQRSEAFKAARTAFLAAAGTEK